MKENPVASMLLDSVQKQANINIFHVENNVVEDSSINKAINQSNQLIRIANLSYYHQSKAEFQLNSLEIKLIKKCGIPVPRS